MTDPTEIIKLLHKVKRERANAIVQQAVRNGTLEKPDACSNCGDKWCHIHGHHEDYDKPLEVEWLCPSCHTKKHPPGKLTSDEISEIRRLHATGKYSHRELGERYNVHRASITNIVNYKRHNRP